MTMPAAVSRWPGAHGHHLLVPPSLPTTEPLWVGTEPISSPCTQPLSYHVCAEWHPVIAPPSCLFASSIHFPIGNQKLYTGGASWCKDGRPRSCHCKRLPRTPLPANSPFSEHPHVIGNKSQECRGAPGACDSICLGSRNHHRHVWELAGGQDVSLRLPMGCGRLRR